MNGKEINMRTREQIENEIAKLEKELNTVSEDAVEETSRVVLKRIFRNSVKLFFGRCGRRNF